MIEPQNAGLPSGWKLPFFTIWTGQAFSLMGSQLVQFALIWWLTKTTGSATVLATAALVGLLPQVFLGPVAGALVDRWNRRIIMMAADSIIALATALLALLFWSGQIQVWHVYLLLFIRSAAGGFHWPAMQASTSLMVPKEHLSRIQGLNQMLMGGMNIASAPLGALLLELLPMQGVLGIDVITALMAISPLFFIHVPQPLRAELSGTGNGKTTVWGDMQAGFRYVWGWTGLMMIALMAIIINFLLNPAFSLVPILVVKHFEGGAFQLAWMNSVWGVGVLTGGFVLSAWGGFRRRILTSMIGLLAMGTGTLIIGFAPGSAFWLALAAMFVTGAAIPITNGPLFAVMQATVAPEMQGRVFTLISSVAAAMTPIGLLIAGPVADALGAQTWFIAGGVTTILMGFSGFFIRPVLAFEDGRQDNKGESLNSTP